MMFFVLLGNSFDDIRRAHFSPELNLRRASPLLFDRELPIYNCVQANPNNSDRED